MRSRSVLCLLILGMASLLLSGQTLTITAANGTTNFIVPLGIDPEFWRGSTHTRAVVY